MDAAGAVGGTTLSASLADSQAQLTQAMGASLDLGADAVAQYAAAYRASGGGPTLAFLGFNPFQLVATGAFHQLYWTAIVVFLGIMAVIALQHVMNGRYSVRGRHPLNGLVQIYFRLAIGVILIANVPLLYGALMTVNRTLTVGLAAISHQTLTQLLRSGGVGQLALAQVRADAIRQAAARRAVALYPANASRTDLIAVGTAYNQLVAGINSARPDESPNALLPVIDTSRWNDAAAPDVEVSAQIGRTLVRQLGPLVAVLASPQCPSASGSLPRLADLLAADDQAAAQALAAPATAATAGAFEQARATYARNVLEHTLSFLDRSLLPLLIGSPSLATRARTWLSETVDHAAAAAASGVLNAVRVALDTAARSIGIVLTRMVAFLFTAGTTALLEIELFVLVLVMPLWLLPATEEAFHGVLRALGTLALVCPAYQFLMLLVDALMGVVLRWIVLGPLAAGAPTAASVAGGSAYAAAGAIAVIGTGGEILALATICYLGAYVFLAIYMAFKTPRIVAALLKGAGAAGEFLSAFATGLLSGAAATFATASVAAGGSFSARWLQAAAAAGRGAGGRGTLRPFGPFVAQATSGSRPAWRATARFGLETFIDAFGAKSPGDGIASALDALAAHRKQQDKEQEAQQKAEAAAAKAAAKADAPAAPKRTRKK